MKINKFLACAMAAVAMTACSDNDGFNTASDVTVSMGQATLNAPEDYTGDNSFCYVPVKLSGKANGPVKVTVDVTEGTVAAIETAHYFITSKTVVIPEGETEVNVEFYPTGDTDINDDREFTMFIADVEGATVEGLDRTVITMLDDDHYLPEAYAKIQGTYNFTAFSSNGSPVSQTWTITGVQEGEDGYLSKLTIAGIQGVTWTSYPATMSFDANTKTASVKVNYGGFCAYEVTFNGGALVADVMLATVSGNSLVSSGSCTLEADENYSSLSFPAGAEWVGALFESASGSFTGSVWFWWDTMSLTKVQ